jgi:pyruvate/oxaloacetate carboxyltransferase
MKKKLLIRDVTLRDGQQSLFATRMTQSQIDRVLPLYKNANFYALEVWGGAVPDSIMRYLKEDPWERLEKIKAAIGDTSKLTALSRGRNLFGYSPYPEQVIEGFNRCSVQSGIGIMRIFDALNDTDNMKSTVKYVKENGGIADCAVCFTVDSKFTRTQRALALLKGHRLPRNIFTIDYFIEKAKEMEAFGADMITVKDMAGLIPPSMCGELIGRMKKELKIPIDIHTHCTPGYGLAAVLMSMLNGVDIVDTALLNFAGGPAAPSFEIIQIFADKLGFETGVNLEAVVAINKELKKIREELSEFDSYKLFPIDFDIINSKLPKDIDELFDKAILFAQQDKEGKLLEICHQIDEYFNFPEPDHEVRKAEIPGGMYTNMLAQLKQLKLDHLLTKVLLIVPEVRIAAGCPPLVTPTSQIVGVQAVNNIIDENSGNPPYTNKSVQFVNLVKGSYGTTPIPIDPDFREKICGHKEEIPYDTKNYKKQENPFYPEFGNRKLAKNEKEELLLELFPNVAKDFLYQKIESEYFNEIQEAEVEKMRAYMEKRDAYQRLSADEKRKKILEGLYHFKWTSYGEW